MSFDSVVERADQQDEQEIANLPKFTQEELEGFLQSRVWKRLEHEMTVQITLAQMVRNDDSVSRDSERLHLGIIKGINACLKWPYDSLNNHKQTQTEGNQYE
jgi:hypothetical protein